MDSGAALIGLYNSQIPINIFTLLIDLCRMLQTNNASFHAKHFSIILLYIYSVQPKIDYVILLYSPSSHITIRQTNKKCSYLITMSCLISQWQQCHWRIR